MPGGLAELIPEPRKGMGVTEPTNQHYDLDPRLFALFLGRTMKYSAALYPTGRESLDQAQVLKLRYVSDCLGADQGQRCLDVGCGWGCLAIHLATMHGCNVVAVTPACRQARFIEKRAEAEGVAHLVTVECSRIEDLTIPRGTFDSAAMLGSVVHMSKRDFVVRKVYESLAPGGRLYLSESCYRNRRLFERLSPSVGAEFVRNAVFGSGEMVPLSTIIASIENAGFSLHGLRDLTADYRRTIDDWLANVRRHHTEMDELLEGASQMIAQYLETGNAAWGIAAKHYAISAVKER